MTTQTDIKDVVDSVLELEGERAPFDTLYDKKPEVGVLLNAFAKCISALGVTPADIQTEGNLLNKVCDQTLRAALIRKKVKLSREMCDKIASVEWMHEELQNEYDSGRLLMKEEAGFEKLQERGTFYDEKVKEYVRRIKSTEKILLDLKYNANLSEERLTEMENENERKRRELAEVRESLKKYAGFEPNESSLSAAIRATKAELERFDEQYHQLSMS